MAVTYEHLVLDLNQDGTLINRIVGGFSPIQAYLDLLGADNWQVVAILVPPAGPVKVILKRSSADL